MKVDLKKMNKIITGIVKMSILTLNSRFDIWNYMKMWIYGERVH